MMQNFFSFQGRLNRKPYWLRALLLVFLFAVAVVVLAFAGASLGLGQSAIFLLIPLYLLILIVVLSLAVRRLHDRNKSGWWLMVFYVLPMILGGVAAYMSFPADLSSLGDPNAVPPAISLNPISIVLQLASFGLSIWGLIEMGFLKGTTGDNQYGPDPLAGMQ